MNAQKTTKGKSPAPHFACGFRTNKRAILFLGAGASKEAKNAAGQTPPDADQLRDILAQRFFGQPMKTRDVMAVAEMAIANSGGSGLVFNAVRQAFEGFQPSKAHRLISAFNWRTIATTNYDLLVEKAYSGSPQRLQTLVPFVKDDEPMLIRLKPKSTRSGDDLSVP